MKQLTIVFLLFVYFNTFDLLAQEIAILKYNGGGDWYSNPTALPNLIRFCNANIGTQIDENTENVAVGSSTIFQYPFLHMTGHGNVVFSEEEAKNLRTYLLSGGFLHIDDNYGMEPYLRKELPKVFPDKELVEIGADHPIFKQEFNFPDGLPKIHEHDGKRPQALGLFHENRMVLLFTYESDLGDGWEDPAVHNDSEEVREKALKMGANIISYVFKN
ncbi:DUF4159 domain-containing protein [Flavobacteriaceae bacterium TP-CH-4]|uniref:DUF4159 domain-containing protein n=1 Tax=Pelagihabitans pacificus TaxID=2696054 RepID=A0A967AVF5_9FLAO|nr:DUF4159 domain-containing protein [Pelagihabitans pacificus]NHF61109.1 DUF4159 domain-containing protein [Pelagihabitans pacificus]